MICNTILYICKVIIVRTKSTCNEQTKENMADKPSRYKEDESPRVHAVGKIVYRFQQTPQKHENSVKCCGYKWLKYKQGNICRRYNDIHYLAEKEHIICNIAHNNVSC